MPDWMSRERKDLIASFGAAIVQVTRPEGGFLGSIQRAQELADANPHVFLPAQFSNDANPAAHEATTGPEILEQLALAGATPDAFVAGVGTGGTVMGVGRWPVLVTATPCSLPRMRFATEICDPPRGCGRTATDGEGTSSGPAVTSRGSAP